MTMKAFVFLLAAIALIAPLRADPTPIDTSHSYTLISVGKQGWMVTATDSLCSISAPGQLLPLRLKIVQGLADSKGVSLESEASSGYFLRHQNSRLKLHPYAENDSLFASDATFYIEQNADKSVSLRSYNYPNEYVAITESNDLYIAIDPVLSTRSFILGN